MVKEILRMAGRLSRAQGLCADPQCVLAPSPSPCVDLDTKDERYCRACEMSGCSKANMLL